MTTLNMQFGHYLQRASALAVLPFTLLVGSLAILPSNAQAQGFNNDYQGCAADRPCFNGYRQVGDRVVFNFTGITGWDFYNVRYNAAGGGVKQVENRSGSYTFTNVRPRSTYTINVQGCRSRFLASSRCSPWVQQSVTTR